MSNSDDTFIKTTNVSKQKIKFICMNLAKTIDRPTDSNIRYCDIEDALNQLWEQEHMELISNDPAFKVCVFKKYIDE